MHMCMPMSALACPDMPSSPHRPPSAANSRSFLYPRLCGLGQKAVFHHRRKEASVPIPTSLLNLLLLLLLPLLHYAAFADMSRPHSPCLILRGMTVLRSPI